MTDDKYKPRPLLYVLFFLLLALAALPAEASGKCNGYSNCNDNSVNVPVTTGDTNVSNKDSPKVFAMSGGDMDINDGLASYSYLFGLIQGTSPNIVLYARQLTMQGKYKLAAETMCNGSWRLRKAVTGKWFRNKAACITALDFTDKPPPPLPTSNNKSSKPDDDDEDYREEQQQVIAQLVAQVVQVQQQTVELEQQIEQQPAQVVKVVTDQKLVERLVQLIG